MDSPLAMKGLIVGLALLCAVHASRGECQQINSCSCRDPETGKIIDLHALASETGPAFTFEYEDMYQFAYNPCVGFFVPGSGQCQNAALCQTDIKQSYNYLLGTQSSAMFIEANTSAKYAIRYRGAPIGRGNERVSTLDLVCDEQAVNSTVQYLGEQTEGVYLFRLVSKCSCPGGCSGEPPSAPTCTPEGPKNCACRLSSDNELINLLSLDNPAAPLVVSTSTSRVYLNPCTGVDLGQGCTDAVSCVYQAGQYTEYGHPSTEQYTVDNATGQVTLSYKSLDGTKQTRIRLVCDQAQRHYPRLTDVGEPTESLLELELRSVCACPGECFSPPTTCTQVDDCTCSLNEGLGTISLHDLDNPFAPLRKYVPNTQEPSTGVWYYYNPCTNFSVSGNQNLCRDVAACQVGSPTPIDMPLGLQSTVTYRTSSTDPDTVTLLYTEGYHDRQVAVTIHCNQSATIPTLDFDREDPEKHYFLSLYSSAACPKTALPEELEHKNIRHSRPIFQN